MHLEFFVEEPSAEAALELLIPKLAPGSSFRVHNFSNKGSLLKKLEQRLRPYATLLPALKNGGLVCKIIVLLDADDDDCRELKMEMEEKASRVGLITKARNNKGFQVVNRIVIEELEAWYFGDVQAVAAAYPGVPPTLDQKAKYRDPDSITGGTWEALEKVLQGAGYHRGGLAKIQAARDIAQYMEPERNTSRSFQVFCEGIRAALDDP